MQKNEEPSAPKQSRKMTPKQIASILLIVGGLAIMTAGFALTIIPLLVIGIPIAAFGSVLLLL